MSDERAALLATFTDAWERGDVDALMGLMAADCWFRASVGPEPGRTFHGPVEVRRGFSAFLTAAASGPPSEVEPLPPLVSDDFAVTRWTTRMAQADGLQLVVKACDVFEFAGDRIRSKDTYRKVDG